MSWQLTLELASGLAGAAAIGFGLAWLLRGGVLRKRLQAGWQARLDRRTAALGRYHVKVKGLERDLSSARAELATRDKRLAASVGEREALVVAKGVVEADRSTLVGELGAALSELEVRKGEEARQKAELARERATAESLGEKLRKLQDGLPVLVARHADQVATLERKLSDATAERDRKESGLVAAHESLADQLRRAGELGQAHDKVASELRRRLADLSAQHAELESTRAELDRLRAVLAERGRELVEVERMRRKLVEQEQAAADQDRAARSEIEGLRRELAALRAANPDPAAAPQPADARPAERTAAGEHQGQVRNLFGDPLAPPPGAKRRKPRKPRAKKPVEDAAGAAPPAEAPDPQPGSEPRRRRKPE